MNVQKAFKTNAQSIPAWEYEQQVKQSRKQAKNMRALRQNRKGMWISGE